MGLCVDNAKYIQQFIYSSVSGSHDNWLTPTIIYNRIVLSASQKLAARYLQTPSSDEHAQIYI